MQPRDGDEVMLRTGEVARLFRVDPKTVNRWVRRGKLPAVRTPGGHYRFKASQIREVLRNSMADGKPIVLR